MRTVVEEHLPNPHTRSRLRLTHTHVVLGASVMEAAKGRRALFLEVGRWRVRIAGSGAGTGAGSGATYFSSVPIWRLGGSWTRDQHAGWAREVSPKGGQVRSTHGGKRSRAGALVLEHRKGPLRAAFHNTARLPALRGGSTSGGSMGACSEGVALDPPACWANILL